MEKFKFQKQLRHGRFGEVWLVKCCATRKQYVLKQINLRHVSKREQNAARLEAKLLSTLKHPNIVSYLDSFYNRFGSLFIITGYCESGDLYNHIQNQRGSYFEEKQIVYWTVQICMALKYLHDKQILHRDLKTQNIFLTKLKIIKIGDLGIARVLNSTADMATTLIGTPYYMSPELFNNKPYNHKSDIWSMGCCIYEMLTLKQAFSAQDISSLMQNILNCKLSSVLPSQYSPELSNLVSLLLAHDPDKRPNANEILFNAYLRKHMLLFLKDTDNCVFSNSRKSKNAIYSDCGKVESEKKDLVDRSKDLKYENKNKKGSTSVPDINGNGDGNDNSQQRKSKIQMDTKAFNCNRMNSKEAAPNSQLLDSVSGFKTASKENFNSEKAQRKCILLQSSHSDAAGHPFYSSNATPELQLRKLHTSGSSKGIENSGELSLKFLSSLTYTIQQGQNLKVHFGGILTPCLHNSENICFFCGSANASTHLNLTLPKVKEAQNSSRTENLPTESKVDRHLLRQIMDITKPNTVARQRRREQMKIQKNSLSAPARLKTFPCIALN